MIGNWIKTGMLMAVIIELFGVVGATLGGLFSTHPSTEERVRRLSALPAV